MKSARWTPIAQRDLRRQFSYWIRVDARIAAELMAAIASKAEWLARFPGTGAPFGSRARKSLVENTPFLIIYRPSGDTVEILRVRHTSENWLPR